MKTVITLLAGAMMSFSFAEELKTLSDADKALLARDYGKLSKEEKIKRDALANLRAMIEEGGEMSYPGTPSGRILIVNLQDRVPGKMLEKLHEAFFSMMEYDLQFTNKEAAAEIVVRIVDKPGQKSLTVWPDDCQIEVNVAALAEDNPKPAFLAARTRKEVLRGFSCATAGTSYGMSLYGKLRSVKDLDNVAHEAFPVDIIMRTMSFLKEAGIEPLRMSTYREVLESGYDVAPTNGYQKAIYEEVRKTTKLTKKIK